jgi:hypothetical protein
MSCGGERVAPLRQAISMLWEKNLECLIGQAFLPYRKEFYENNEQ